MTKGLEKHSCSVNARLFLISLICIVFLPAPSSAAQWQKLAQTNRFQVSIEMDSVQTLQEGVIKVWLSFVPLGARSRLEAAKEYAKKEYRQHLEQYEIDCIEQSAALKQIEILGRNRKPIGRELSNGTFDVIIPGSALEIAALLVCPKREYVESEEQALRENISLKEVQDYSDRLPGEEHKQRISEAKTKSVSEPENAATWIELGNAYFDADLPKESIEAYNQALKIQPNNIEVLNDQGAMYRKIGDFQNALNNHEKVLKIAPDNLESLYLIGYIYAIELDRTKEAIPLWHRYLTIDSSSETAKQIRQYIEKYGK